MENAQETSSIVYKSPLRKLVRFFEKSRNGWKVKCRTAKAMLKRLKNRVRFLEQSRARWRERAQELEKELAQVKAARQILEREVEALKSELNDAQRVRQPEGFEVIGVGHQYSVGHIELFISLVLSAASSLRGAGKGMAVVFSCLGIESDCPTWQTGRLWLLRLGYYKLTRPKVQADDWVWIMDHTLQLGAEKCLLILGVRLSALPAVGKCLGHADVEPIALLPVKQSDGQIVFQQLEQAAEKTGVPRAIVSDHGRDLELGVSLYCQAHPETSPIYDIKHKTAAVLKHELERDAVWVHFTQLASQTKRQLQQTDWAALAPPQQRTKARYMNVDVLIEWGQGVLAFVDTLPASTPFNADQVHAKLGWITDFRQPLLEWNELLTLVTLTENFVRQRGLYQAAPAELELCLPLVHTPRAQKVRTELMIFVTQEAAKTRPNERLVGSSEVIESVLGKLKYLERDQAKSGFTGLVLGVCAGVSSLSQAVIQKALETVSTQKVLDWCKENLGPSVQAKRRQAFDTS